MKKIIFSLPFLAFSLHAFDDQTRPPIETNANEIKAALSPKEKRLSLAYFDQAKMHFTSAQKNEESLNAHNLWNVHIEKALLACNQAARMKPAEACRLALEIFQFIEEKNILRYVREKYKGVINVIDVDAKFTYISSMIQLNNYTLVTTHLGEEKIKEIQQRLIEKLILLTNSPDEKYFSSFLLMKKIHELLKITTTEDVAAEPF